MPERVLIVEDEFIIALDLQSIVEGIGAEPVGPAISIREALLLAEGVDITCAILDLRIGQTSIAPVARRLADRKIPFLFYSGQLESDPILEDWPDIPLITKPAPAKLIAQRLQSLFGATH